MAHDLFDQTLVPRTVNRGRRGTVVVSLALHAAALAIIVALQFTSNVDGPHLVQPLVAFVATPELPKVPDLRPVAPSTTPPTAAPTAVVREVPINAPDQMPPPGAEPADVPRDLHGLVGRVDLTRVGSGGVADSALVGAPPPVTPSAPPPVLRVGGQIAAPARLHYQAPRYPSIAQTARVDGTVILEATIDEGGLVRDVRVIRSIPLLDRAAIEAVGTWRYTPTRLNGVAVPVVMTVTVTFSLRH